MLPKKFRLKINKAGSEKWPNKKFIYTPLFKFIYRYDEKTLETPKVGFIISGKIGKAVQRNRARRILTEAVRKKIKEFPPQIEAVIIGNKGLDKAAHEEISDQVNKILSKINIPAK